LVSPLLDDATNARQSSDKSPQESARTC